MLASSFLMHLHTTAHNPNMHITKRDRDRNGTCAFTWKQAMEIIIALLRDPPACHWGPLGEEQVDREISKPVSDPSKAPEDDTLLSIVNLNEFTNRMKRQNM